ncbi:MAG: TolC family protein [Aureispira sp.]
MKTTSILLAALFLAFGMQAQNVEQFSLTEAIGYAQTKSNSIRDGQLDIARAKADVQEYTAIGIPKVNAKVDYNYYIDIPTQLLPNDAFAIPGAPPPEPGFSEVQFGTRHNLTPSITVSTLVLDGSYFVGLKASKGLLDMTKRQADLTKYDIKYNVVQAYLQALLVEENKDVLLLNIENLKKIRYETNAFYENGMVERLDVDRLDLSISNLTVQLETLERQMQLAKNVLKFQMNYPLDDSIVLTERLEDVIAIVETTDLEGDIQYDRRIETDILKRTIALNELNIKRFHMGYLPNITAFFTHQQQLQRNDLFDNDEPGFFPTTIVGATLNVPIFDGLDKAAKIKRARIDVAKFQLQLNDLERGIQLEVLNARANYQNAKERLENQDENLALAERILETTRIKYREGVGSSLEMTQAEQELYRTQANRLNALYDLVLAKAALDKALGK